MSETAKKQNHHAKRIVAAVILLIAAAAAAAVIYVKFSPKAQDGAKTVTIEVTDDKEETVSYTVHTDAEFLRQAMEEAEGLSFDGTESEYGLMVETVNAVTADYNENGTYWAFYVNGEYCSYGIDSQPVADGETYQIVYTTE